MPTTPYDVKGLLVSSIEDNNPVIFLEHRWLYNISGEVPEGIYRVPIGQAKAVRNGTDITIVATSYMTLESIRAADTLAKYGISVEVIDIRTLRPLDENAILESAGKTGRLLVVDSGTVTGGIGAEIVARVAEKAFPQLKGPIIRIGLPDCPSPTSPGLSQYFYPRASKIARTVRKMIGITGDNIEDELDMADAEVPHDVPDKYFTGPF
jgi:pyruvate dehydrogenase E1 component beta subunit